VRSFSAVLKMVFAIMLVCLVFAVRPARAYQVGEYNCISGWSTCWSQTEATMAQCMGECCEYGGCGSGEAVCYIEEQTIGWSDGDYIVNDDQTCASVPEPIYNCAVACMQDFEGNTGECLQAYCTYVG
jgi:hypothetical protein